MTGAGSEFQTDGAAHRKECFAKPIRANGWTSSDVAVERPCTDAAVDASAEVLRYRRVQSLVRQQRHLVVNSVSNWQPVYNTVCVVAGFMRVISCYSYLPL